MTNSSNWKIGITLSLTTAMMWGFLPISIMPLLGSLDPYTITFYRLSSGGILLFTWLVMTGYKPSKVKLTKSLILFLCTNYYSWLKGLELICIIVSAGALVFLLLASPAKILELNELQLWMLKFGAINTAVAYGCFTQAMHYWETSRVSALVAIVPVLTLVIGYMQQTFFPEFMTVEPINSLSIIGAVVVIGSAITALSKTPNNE